MNLYSNAGQKTSRNWSQPRKWCASLSAISWFSSECLTTICYTSLPRTIDSKASFVWPWLSRGWRPRSRPKSSMRSLKSCLPHFKMFSGSSRRLGRPNPRPKNNEHCCIIQMAISMYLFNFTKWVLVPVQGCNQEFGLGKQSQWVGIICHPWLR